MRTILHVLGRLSRGGTEVRLVELLSRLDPSQYRFEFCCLSGQRGELEAEVRQLGGSVHLVPLDVRFPTAFIRLLRAGNYAGVQSHVHYASGLILFLAACAGVQKRIAHFRNSEDGRGGSPHRILYRYIMKCLIARYATDILAVSRAAMTGGWGKRWHWDPRCRVIYNGVDLEKFPRGTDRDAIRLSMQIPLDATVVCHVGNMSRAKNHERLVGIFAELRKMVPGAILLIVGQPEEKIQTALLSKVDELQLQGTVRILGKCDDVPRILRASDLFLFPSRWEGLPGAVLEACAAGLPVVASNLGGVAEIAQYFENVGMLSLDEPDPRWAELASQFVRRRRRESVDARAEFGQTPFVLDTCVRHYLQALEK